MLFNNSLKQLIVGLSSGYIEIFSAITMTKTQEHERLSENKFCQQLIMSGDERYIAARDNGCVTLFKYGRYSEAVEKESWYFNGRLKSHDQDVTSIAFFNYKEGDSIKSYLFSIGKDKYMVRYDIYQSSETKGLKDDKYLKIELESIPTSIFFYPEEIEGDPFMAVFNSDYKLRLWDPFTFECRRTCLGPTYGGAVERAVVFTTKYANNDVYYVAYSTAEKVIGLMKLPADGNPNKTIGLIGHPKTLSDFCVSDDAKYLFSCGTKKYDFPDYIVNVWKIDVSVIENAVMMAGEDIDIFINLLEGGKDGLEYKELLEYFFYTQILSMEENTTKTRKMTGAVPLSKLGYLMRALGYFPSNKELADMESEVRYTKLKETGQRIDDIDINTFIKLFVNNRPLYSATKAEIIEAFKKLVKKSDKPKEEEKIEGIQLGTYII
jgi:hypothetical protein